MAVAVVSRSPPHFAGFGPHVVSWGVRQPVEIPRCHLPYLESGIFHTDVT